jgi:hypothetical protein
MRCAIRRIDESRVTRKKREELAMLMLMLKLKLRAPFDITL